MPDNVRTGRRRRIAAFAAIVAIQFALFETGMRTWGSSEAAPAFQGLFTDDPTIGYRLKPDARVRFTTDEFDTIIATNHLGLRDDAELGPKPAGERRILVLGDSLVLAVQVPYAQTFAALLEQRLNDAPSPVRYRVVNAGVQGYGPVEELLLLRSIIDAVEPDLVIETLFVGNDAEEAVTSAPRLSGGRAAATALRDSFATRLRRLFRRSMVLQVLRLRVVEAAGRLSLTGAPPEAPLQTYAARPAPRIAQGLAITRQVVEGVIAESSGAGARTSVLLMPARFQVDDADYGRLRQAVAAAGGALVRDGATERFKEALAGLNVPVLDPLPALRRALPGPDLFFQQTVHLTPRGHEIVAAAMDRFLTETGLLDPPTPR